MIKADHRPLYLQVIDKIKQDIDAGEYEAGERLPSEFELSKKLGISRATLREALRMLEDENVIVRRHGVGTFVCNKPLFTGGIEELTSITDMIRNVNCEPGTIFLSSNIVKAKEEDFKKFKLGSFEQLIEVERVRTANNEPVVYCIDKIPHHFLPNYSTHDNEQSIFDRLEKEGTPISYAITQIEPVGYHEQVSETLQSPHDSALLLLKQMHYDDRDQPILYSINYFRADKFKFHVLRKRG